jgi:hypothetical protein
MSSLSMSRPATAGQNTCEMSAMTLSVVSPVT